MSELTLDASELEQHITAVMQTLPPSAQAALARKIAKALLDDTKASMQRQESPDGKAWSARKRINGKPTSKRKMFVRMRLAKHLKIRNKPGQAVIGWVGPAARIARISQFGLTDPNNFDADYPKRPLIGLTPEHKELIQSTVNQFLLSE